MLCVLNTQHFREVKVDPERKVWKFRGKKRKYKYKA